jgi:hypothetical protein
LAQAGVCPRDVADPLIHGRVAQARGDLSEDRVVRLLLGDPRRPSWLSGARRTEPNSPEDKAGVDVVVYVSDMGPLLLQVKSSHAGVKRFRKRLRLLERWVPGKREPIGVVLANPEADDTVVWEAAMGALVLLREAATGGGGP